jgi:hypothetical protein
VRGPVTTGLDAPWIARALQMPLVGEVPEEPALAAGRGDGRPPGAYARGPLAAFCAAFWEKALSGEAVRTDAASAS